MQVNSINIEEQQERPRSIIKYISRQRGSGGEISDSASASDSRRPDQHLRPARICAEAGESP